MFEQIQLSQAEDISEGNGQFKLFAIPLSSLSREECIKEQAADPMVKSLFELVCPEGELKGVPRGYFLNDFLLSLASQRWYRLMYRLGCNFWHLSPIGKIGKTTKG